MVITTALMAVPVSMKPASVQRDLEETTACTVSRNGQPVVLSSSTLTWPVQCK